MFRFAALIAVFTLTCCFQSGCSKNPTESTGQQGRQSTANSDAQAENSAKPDTQAGVSPTEPPADKQPASVIDSPGRALTTFVLKNGGNVSAYVGAKQMSWSQDAELPGGKIEPFLVKLEGVEIRDDEMKLFAGQPKLITLYLNQSTVTDTGLKHLADLPKLEALQLSGTKITDAGVAHFAEFPSLQQLYLNSTNIGDAGLKTISQLPGITVLWIADTKVTDAGMAQVGTMKKLFRLNLQKTAITDRGLAQLAELKSLNSCDVRGTSVTQAAAKTLDEQLPNGSVAWAN